MSPRSTRTTILLVEDDRNTREMYRLALIVAGFQVIAVGDGLDALRVLEAERPALVVLDLGLPRLNGRDVQRELASDAETRHIPVVVVTGSDTTTLNPDDVSCILRKPASPDALVRAVVRCLERAARFE